MSLPGNTPPKQELTSGEIVTQAAQTVVNGLRDAYDVYLALGPAGVEAKQQNRFGETALEADVDSEAALIAQLKQLPLPVTIHSEEHGILTVNEDESKAGLLAVIDGLDGSSVYQKNREHGKYGTMFAIFDSDDPTYSEYLATGILLHTDATILLARKDAPLEAINLATGQITYPSTDSVTQLTSGAVAFADKSSVDTTNPLYQFFALNSSMASKLEAATGVETSRTGSTAANIGLVAVGGAALDLGATRKGNLEYASGYAIVTSAGGVVVDAEGNDLGPQKFKSYGQTEHLPVIVAANKLVATQVVTALKN